MESTTPLLSVSPTNNHLMDKVFFGLGTLGALGVTIYQGVSIAQNSSPKKNDWIALGTSVTCLGLLLFGLIRSFKHTQELNQKNVYIDIVESKSNSDLIKIYQKINTILEVKKLTGCNIQIDFSEQEISEQQILEISEVLSQLDSLNHHLKSKNSIIQDFEKNKLVDEQAHSKEISKFVNLLEESKKELKTKEKELESANIGGETQSKEIIRLNNLLEVTISESNKKIENLVVANDKEQIQSKEITNLKILIEKMEKEKKEFAFEKALALEDAYDKISTLEAINDFYKTQFMDIQLNLGSPKKPIVSDVVENTRIQIASILKEGHASGASTGLNSLITSGANTPFATPQNSPFKSSNNNS